MSEVSKVDYLKYKLSHWEEEKDFLISTYGRAYYESHIKKIKAELKEAMKSEVL